jgi:hypothetical protein
MKRAFDATMNRRTFLRTGTCGLAGISFASLAQTKKMPRVGVLFSINAARIVGDALSHRLPTFGGSRPLVEAGYLASIGSDLAAIAKALGLTIPQSLLLRAGEAIQ